MWSKRELRCDICKELIDDELPYPVVQVPLSSDDRERIIADIKRQLPHQIKVIFDGIGAAAMIPAAWKLEVCQLCMEKAFPEIGFEKTKQIIEAIERKESIRKKHAAVVASADDDD